MKYKTCTGECGQLKPLTEFPKRKDSIDGHRHECKECYSSRLKKIKETPEVIENRKLRQEEKERKDAEKQNRKICCAMYKAAKALYKMSETYHENRKADLRERMREKRKDPEYKEKEKQKQKELYDAGYFDEWHKNNPEKIKQYQQNSNNKRKNNPWLKTKGNLRKIITRTLNSKGIAKNCKSLEILTVDWKTAIEHIGEYKPGTHIDHIIPMAFAEYGNEREAYALNSIWNLRRITAEENMKKGDSLPSRELLHPNLPSLAIEIYERNARDGGRDCG